MAIINAFATGNWSATGTWPGGVLPTAADTVYANGKTVTIDQNITVVSINTTAGGGGVAGGGFLVNAGRVINGDVNAGSTNCLAITLVGSYTINGNVTGSSTNGIVGINFTAGGATVTIVGNVTGGSAGPGITTNSNSGTLNVTGDVISLASGNGITLGNNTNLNITGNVYGGNGNSQGCGLGGTGTITITGNVFGGSGNSNGVLISNVITSLTINGSVYGATSFGQNGGAGVQIQVASTVIINGNVVGGAFETKYGLYFTASAATTCTVNGNITGGTAAPGSYHSAANGATILIVTGTLTATNSASAVQCLNDTHILRAKGPFIATNGAIGKQAAHISNLQLLRTNPTENYFDVRDHTNSVPIRLSTPEFATDLPDEEDVRYGTVYGGTLVGELHVPLPGQVALGIETDDTEGTAVLTSASVWDYPRASATTVGSMGERLKNAATVESTGDQIATI